MVANIDVTFHSEIKFDDEVHIVTRCTKVGGKSFRLEQVIYADDRKATSAASVLVGFDAETRTTVPMLSGWQPSLPEDDLRAGRPKA